MSENDPSLSKSDLPPTSAAPYGREMPKTSSRTRTITVNGQTIEARPRETILEAALRSRIALPNACRVGGCGTCRCRLVEGRVHERTETGYILSADELARKTILACQSVPETDVRIELDGSRPAVSGTVVTRAALTADIARITVALDAPLAYRAGQYASVRLDGPFGLARSYSFAAPADASGHVNFFVRHVAGGAISSRLHDPSIVGRAITVEGPHGDVWLRPGDAPLLFIAGGSGLAPILAMLEQAADACESRPATLLFGVRSEHDLFALDAIEDVARRWGASFHFVPIVAEPTGNAGWSGACGQVTDLLAAHYEAGADVYVCGAAGMVDAAKATLAVLGAAEGRIWSDRFVTSTAPVAANGPPAGAIDYLKYLSFHLVGLVALASLVAGGWRVTAGLVAVLMAYIVGDAVSGDDVTTPVYRRPWILTLQLWLALPLVSAIAFAAAWSVSREDPLAVGAWLSRALGHDLLAARANTSAGEHVAGFVLTGLMIGMVGTIPAHELTHRTWDRVSLFVGRCLLAFSFDTSFAIEHVYGHHRYVGTSADPATAPRGRNVYRHIVESTITGNVSAWRIEAARLRKRGWAVLSLHNRFLRGHAMSVAGVVLALVATGWRGAAFLVACGLWGKALLEIVNYIEHYGIVRAETTPVAPRHSWNTNKRVSSWTMFNLTRHSHHHAEGELPYYRLVPYPDAPMMLSGYLTTLVIAMIPPLWYRWMTPRVEAWDRDHASAEERALVARRHRGTGSSSSSEVAPRPAERIAPGSPILRNQCGRRS